MIVIVIAAFPILGACMYVSIVKQYQEKTRDEEEV